MLDYIVAHDHDVSRWVILGLFLMIALWAWTVPRSEIYTDAPSQSRWRDLRLWGTAWMAIMAAVYYRFG